MLVWSYRDLKPKKAKRPEDLLYGINQVPIPTFKKHTTTRQINLSSRLTEIY